jgi:hypothetical protein
MTIDRFLLPQTIDVLKLDDDHVANIRRSDHGMVVLPV